MLPIDTKTWLKLLHIETFSAEKLAAILKQGILLEEPETFSEKKLRLLGFTEKQALRWQQVSPDTLQKELQWLESDDQHLVTMLDEHYPTLLKEIPDPPLALFVKGDTKLLSTLQSAMVGSRNPTAAGSEIAFDFARYLANSGLTITSGLATGIDTASHRGALDASGKTIAVCGTGLQEIYPVGNRALAQQIATTGAIISEFPLYAKPQAYHFPRRNRIISGLSLGVLVVEAAQRSGSLITARLGSEQGREVFAIPGSIHNPLARGCHSLLRQGAKLVETAADIIEELGALTNLTDEENKQNQTVENNDFAPILDEEYQQLLSYIDYTPMPVDVLVARSGLETAAVSSMLLLIELQSLVQSEAGGYRRTK